MAAGIQRLEPHGFLDNLTPRQYAEQYLEKLFDGEGQNSQNSLIMAVPIMG